MICLLVSDCQAAAAAAEAVVAVDFLQLAMGTDCLPSRSSSWISRSSWSEYPVEREKNKILSGSQFC